MAVRPFPLIPCVTSSAVEEAENPDGPFLLTNHIPLFLSDQSSRPLAKCKLLRLRIFLEGTEILRIKSHGRFELWISMKIQV